jgi:glycosyltransferase involved in cell wall biosynthesis
MLTAIRNRCGIPLDGVLRGMRRMSGWFTRRAQKTQVDSDVRPLPRSEFDNRRAAFLDAACNANAVLVPTDTFRTSFIEWGIPESLLQHVSQGRDHAPFDRLNPVPRGSGSLRVGFIGQIAAHKGVRELIAAVQQIEEDRIDLRIIGPVVGDRSYLAECKSDSADNANVHFVGSIGSNEIPGVYETLDVLVVPSLWNECSPLTIQEAFMSGVPVVASDIGGMREMIEHDVSGLLFPMGDVDALASALRQLCDDEDLRQRLADGVPDVCSLADHAAELRGLYAEALGGS